MDQPTAGLGTITTIRKPESKPNANTTSALFRSLSWRLLAGTWGVLGPVQSRCVSSCRGADLDGMK